METMTNPGSLFYQLIQDLAQGKGIPLLVWRLAQILNRPVVLTDSVHRVIASQDPLGLNLELSEFIYVPPVKIKEPDLLSCSEQGLHQFQLTSGPNSFPSVYLPLQSGDYCLGYCIVLDTCCLSGA